MARKRETSPEEIVQAAIRCFAKKGYHATKTADIAKEAGVSEGTLYNYFKDKSALFVAVIEHINSAIDEEFFFDIDEDNVIEHYIKDVSSIDKFLERNKDYVEIVSRDLRQRDVSGICVDFFDRHESRKKKDLLLLAKACGFEPTEEEIQALTACFNGGIERIITRWCIGGTKGQLEPSPATFINGFISILKRAGRGSNK